jgi:hypothetical protein
MQQNGGIRLCRDPEEDRVGAEALAEDLEEVQAEALEAEVAEDLVDREADSEVRRRTDRTDITAGSARVTVVLTMAEAVVLAA